MAFAQSDYALVLAQCREALRSGNHGGIDPKKVIGCILNAAGTTGMSSPADSLTTVLDAQLAILNAFTGGDDPVAIVAAIATAAAAIATPEAALKTANPSAVSLAPNSTMDG